MLILQYHEIFSGLQHQPAAMSGHIGAVSLKKSNDIVILSFCNIVKGQANSAEYYFDGLSTQKLGFRCSGWKKMCLR